MFTLPETMKALVLDEAKENFELSEACLSLPKVNEQQLLIKVEYAAINATDIQLATLGCQQWQYPHVPLVDGVGIVVSSGCEHSPLIGQRVMWHSNLLKQGALAQYTVVESQSVAQVPDEIAGHLAASLPTAGLTAALTLCSLAVQPGEKILIENACATMGQFAIQIAKDNGLTVFATAEKAHHDYLKKIGADFVYDSQSKKFIEHLKRDLGHEQLDHLVNSIASDTAPPFIDLLKFNGNIACQNNVPELGLDILQAKSPSIHFVSLAGAWLSNDICAQHKLGLKSSLLLEQVKSKQLCLPEVKTIPFDAKSVTSAMHSQGQGDVFTKQVVHVAD